MATATDTQHQSMSFVFFSGHIAAAAGALQILTGFRLFDEHVDLTEILYIVTDLCLLFGLIGWHLHQHDKVGALGLLGFVLMFIGTAFIAGPSAMILGSTAYSVGIPVIAVGLLFMCVCTLRNRTLPHWVIGAFMASFLLMVVAPYAPSLYKPISYTNIFYGIGFLGLSYHLVREHR